MGSIEHFLMECTVPLIYQTDEQVGVRGTGVFFEHHGRSFLVTAGHVVDAIDPNNLGVPERAGKDVCVLHFGDGQVHHPRNTNEYDVAVVELKNKEFVSLANAGWRFRSASNVSLEDEAGGNYIVAGYPARTVESIDGVLTPYALMQIYTGAYDGEVDGVRGEFDLFLRYGRDATNTFGTRKATPELEGVSGAAVYRVLSSRDVLWAPEGILKIVGIQVSYFHSKYVRVKRWALVSHLLSLIPNAPEHVCT